MMQQQANERCRCGHSAEKHGVTCKRKPAVHGQVRCLIEGCKCTNFHGAVEGAEQLRGDAICPNCGRPLTSLDKAWRDHAPSEVLQLIGDFEEECFQCRGHRVLPHKPLPIVLAPSLATTYVIRAVAADGTVLQEDTYELKVVK